MRDLDIVSFEADRRHLRYQCYHTNKDYYWQSFRKSRNELKSKIKSTKKSFYPKALSSKRTKEIWTVIHRILNPDKERILFDPETSSNYYTNMAENLTGTKPTTKNKITQEINALSFNGKTDILTSKDFRLVSLLHVFKRIIMKHLCSFIEDHVIYSNTQSRFRKHRSTNTLLIKRRDDILNTLDRSEVTIAILL